MKITLKDGSVIEAENGATPQSVALGISENLARAALIARVNGELVDLKTPLPGDCKLELLTYKDDDGKTAYRHTASHILAQAIKNVYPAAQLAIGPATNVGFYYDIDLPFAITMDDLAAVENEMTYACYILVLYCRKRNERNNRGGSAHRAYIRYAQTGNGADARI